MDLKRVKTDLINELLYFDIFYLPACKTWWGMIRKSMCYKNFFKKEFCEAES